MKGFRLWTDFRWIVRAAGHISIPVGWIAGWQAGRIDHFLIWQNRFLQWRMCHTRNLRLPLSWKKLFRSELFSLSFASRSAAGEEEVDDVWKLYFQKRTAAVYWPGKLCHWRSSPFSGYASKRKKELLNITVSFQQEEMSFWKNMQNFMDRWPLITGNDSNLKSWQWMEQPFPWEQEGGCR